MRSRLIAICMLMGGIVFPAMAVAQSIKAITAEFRPLQYTENGEIKGYVADAMRVLFDRLAADHKGLVYSMEVLPWKRAMAMSRRQDSPAIFFSLSRTTKREPHYHWIGEVSPYQNGFVKLRSNEKVNAQTIDLLVQQGRVGVSRGSAAQTLVETLGYDEGTHFSTYNHFHDGLKMLHAGRIDALPLSRMFFRNNACKLGLAGDNMEMLFDIDAISNPLWMVANKAMPEDLVVDMRRHLADMQREGVLDGIRESYMTPWRKMSCEEAEKYLN